MGILAARASGHEILFYDDRVEAVPENLDADLVAMSVETFTAHRFLVARCSFFRCVNLSEELHFGKFL